MTRKTLAFVISSLNSGGAERVVSTLSNELLQWYNVKIITFINIKPFYNLSPEIEILPCFETIKPSKNLYQSLYTNYKLYSKIRSFLEEKKVDLTIGFLTASNILAIIASRSLNIPVIVSERINPSSANTPLIWKLLRRIYYPKANFLIVQTKMIENYFRNSIDNSKMIILPNPVTPELEEIKIKEKENIVLNIGRLTYQKGQDFLIESFIKLNPPDWKLVIVGEGNKRLEYENLISEYGMEKKIILVGRQKNVSEYYAKSKIFAFTSRFEGFPNALIEAMFMGLPSISTDCPSGPAELIKNGKNGFLISIDNQNHLMEKLKLLIDNEQLRREFSMSGKKTVMKFSSKEVVKLWDDVIRNVFLETN